MTTVYEAMACAEQGHIRHGVGNGTNPENILWSNNCERCHVVISPAKTDDTQS